MQVGEAGERGEIPHRGFNRRRNLVPRRPILRRLQYSRNFQRIVVVDQLLRDDEGFRRQIERMASCAALVPISLRQSTAAELVEGLALCR